MVTTDPRNIPEPRADTRGPYTRVFRGSRCPLCLHPALPFAQPQSSSPAAAAALVRQDPRIDPRAGVVVGALICVGAVRRGLTHVPALSASCGSVATQGHRHPLHCTLFSHSRVTRRGSREGSSMGGKSGERASLELSPPWGEPLLSGGASGSGAGTLREQWWWHQ